MDTYSAPTRLDPQVCIVHWWSPERDAAQAIRTGLCGAASVRRYLAAQPTVHRGLTPFDSLIEDEDRDDRAYFIATNRSVRRDYFDAIEAGFVGSMDDYLVGDDAPYEETYRVWVREQREQDRP